MLKKSTRWSLLLLGLLLLGLGGCDVFKPKTVRIGAAADVLPLLDTLETRQFQEQEREIVQIATTDALTALREGKVDAALLGREPTDAEREGLVDYVIAYDAVCFLVSQRTYNGGVQIGGTAAVSSFPVMKMEGLTGLSLADLEKHYNNLLHKNEDRWSPGEFLEFEIVTNERGIPLKDPNDPEKVMGNWNPVPIRLVGTVYRAGQFDTQAVVFDVLGLSEADLAHPAVELISERYTLEEEVIAMYFLINPLLDEEESRLEFGFDLVVASRQVAIRALEHEFGLRALAVEGIDPLNANPQAIYDGSYPFSREIHLLTRPDASAEVEALVDWLLSPQGQDAIAASTAFLPLPQEGSDG